MIEAARQPGRWYRVLYIQVLIAVFAGIGVGYFFPAFGKSLEPLGIGFIKLDVDNPADSQVLIPARERDEIDWDMANRLATENRDFLEYVKLVKQFYQTGEARPADWDVPEIDD